jgi:hypothetical protein
VVTGDSAAGRVVLELGPGVGALVVYAPAGLEGAEVEISEAAGDGPAGVPVRTHALVRRRRAGGAVTHAAVYQTLAAGRYVVWGDRDTPLATVTVAEMEVTTWQMPAMAAGRGARGA